ncbi:hypothetical protein Nizo2264_0770 [Lactiplantibacillus plantarum]|nr:hypothetical protein Nizo2264_0770 [Lactiplantibacillus plantarum]
MGLRRFFSLGEDARRAMGTLVRGLNVYFRGIGELLYDNV